MGEMSRNKGKKGFGGQCLCTDYDLGNGGTIRGRGGRVGGEGSGGGYGRRRRDRRVLPFFQTSTNYTELGTEVRMTIADLTQQ